MRRLYIDTSNMDFKNSHSIDLNRNATYTIKDRDDISYSEIRTGESLFRYCKKLYKDETKKCKYINLQSYCWIVDMNYILKKEQEAEAARKADNRDKFFLEFDASNTKILDTDLPESFAEAIQSNGYSVLKFKNDFVVPVKITNTSFSPMEWGTMNAEACTTYLYTYDFTIFVNVRETTTYRSDSLILEFKNIQIMEDFVKFDITMGSATMHDVCIDRQKTQYGKEEFASFTFNHFIKEVLLNHG